MLYTGYHIFQKPVSPKFQVNTAVTLLLQAIV